MKMKIVCSKIRELRQYGIHGQAMLTIPAKIVKALPNGTTAFHVAQLESGLIVLVPINEQNQVQQDLGKLIGDGLTEEQP